MEFLVTQTAYFTWKVEANTPEEAVALNDCKSASSPINTT